MSDSKEENLNYASNWFMKQVENNTDFQSLLDDFNFYVNELLSLTKFVENESERKSLLKELDDDLTYMASKEENKETTRNLLLNYIKNKDGFETALKAI